jgi:8-oxo-dGTP pyrophosphatase MutT (NUDIX family)/arylsulfatase A-like enzyme
MVWDGMRPDLISAELTPNFWRLSQTGVRFRDSHAVFPTVTRINSASLATGSLPAGHGILGNSLYVPAVDARQTINMGDHRALEAVAALRGGRVVARESLADRVAATGGGIVVVSTGSPGSAWLCHPRIRERDEAGDRLLHPAFPIPADALEPAIGRLGPIPAPTIPNSAQNAWFARAVVEHVLPDLDPTLLVFWHTDPDKTQHRRGFGSPDGMASIRDADAHLGQVLAALEAGGRIAETVVAVVSDHGYVTISPHVEASAPDGPFAAPELRAALADGEIVLAPNGGSLYVSIPSGDRALLERMAAALAAWEHGGPIFTRPDADRPGAGGGAPLPGTLPLEAVGIAGDLAPDLLCALAWDDAVNAYGRAGRSAGLDPGLRADHGGISSWEIANTFVLSGAGVKAGLEHRLPAGNVDLAPTLAELLGVGALSEADGRVLAEALVGGPDPREVSVSREPLTADLRPDPSYLGGGPRRWAEATVDPPVDGRDDPLPRPGLDRMTDVPPPSLARGAGEPSPPRPVHGEGAGGEGRFEQHGPWRRLSSRPIYANPWIAVREDQVIRPDGKPGIYGVVEFQHWAIGVVPLTDDGDTFLVGQYRYTLDLYSWEIPEGGGEKAATPLVGAQRELREETGITAARWTYLGEAHLSNSATDEVGCIFLAEQLTLGQADPEGTEDLRLWRLPFAGAVRMALSGEISDALAVIGLLRADQYLKSGRAWQPIERSFPGLGRHPRLRSRRRGAT